MNSSHYSQQRDARAGMIALPSRTKHGEAAQARPERGLPRTALRRCGPFLLAVACSCVAGAAAVRDDTGTATASRYRFSAELPLEAARRAASSPFVPRTLDGSTALKQLTYDQYRDIRFNADAGIWRNEQVPFRLELLPAGFLFQYPVDVAIVESGVARDLKGTADRFVLGPHVADKLAGQDLPLSGFRLRTRLNSRSVWDEFLVFQGASYFRAVDRGGAYGLSARGLALRTAHPAGEEFPMFTRFWVERPATNASGVVIHALLDSPSTSGAFRFSVIPGAETIMDVDMTLFPRVALGNVGIAPLTSMFLFDESERARIDDFRDEVHDSDGLQVVLASGERIWRPLRNPTQLQVSSFTSVAPRGFGLVQRSRRASDYHDFEAHYERRPSAWIQPTSEWGEGQVELVEIPTNNETNDNIVAFWKPAYTVPAGEPWHLSYRIRWTARPRLQPATAQVTSTRTGPSFDGKRRIFVVEFSGTGRRADDLKLDAGTSSGRLSNLVLQPNSLTKGVRASFELDPGDSDVAELRLRLVRNGPRGDRPASETWLYRWTAS